MSTPKAPDWAADAAAEAFGACDEDKWVTQDELAAIIRRHAEPTINKWIVMAGTLCGTLELISAQLECEPEKVDDAVRRLLAQFRTLEADAEAEAAIDADEKKALREQLAELREEIRVLRGWGNKDCTAMADAELAMRRAHQ